jgi:haloalkane dehalogenase
VVSNTGLPTGEQPPTEAFIAWRNFSQNSPVFPIGTIVNGGSATELSEEIVAAYDAPFPDDTYKAGARIFPSFVPTSIDDPAYHDNVKAWEILKKFERPGAKPFMTLIPGAQGQPHVTVEGGGHFIQEDKGEELAALIASFIASTPL